MSERLEKIADEILAVVNKKRVSGETPEKDVWVATYLPNREQIAVIFGDREVSGSYVQKRFNKDDKQSIISTLEQLYGAEPRNHNEQSLDEDTVYDHSWYEVKKQKYPKRTKNGVEGLPIKESKNENNDEIERIHNEYLENKLNAFQAIEDLYIYTNFSTKEIDEILYKWSEEKEKIKSDKEEKELNDIWDDEELNETCSGGATCAGAVGSVKKSVSKVTRAACLPKRKKKKMSESIDSILFKESILNDMPCESKIEGHQFKYFMNEGKWYLSVDNCLAKTHDKDVMMETFDQIVDEEKVTTSLLEDYSCYEMELLMEDEENATANPNSPDNLTGSPANNDLPQPGIAMDMALNKDIENNEKERNDGQPEQPETALQQQEEQDYDKNELEKLKGQKVFHRNPETKKLEPVTLGDKIDTSNGKPARSFTTADGKPGADYSEELLAKETL